MIPLQEGVESASSMVIIETAQKHLGINGHLFLADCGVIPNPTHNQLADIAVTTASLALHLTDQTPRVALLAYSTKALSLIHISKISEGVREGWVGGWSGMAESELVVRGCFSA